MSHRLVVAAVKELHMSWKYESCVAVYFSAPTTRRFHVLCGPQFEMSGGLPTRVALVLQRLGEPVIVL